MDHKFTNDPSRLPALLKSFICLFRFFLFFFFGGGMSAYRPTLKYLLHSCCIFHEVITGLKQKKLFIRASTSMLCLMSCSLSLGDMSQNWPTFGLVSLWAQTDATSTDRVIRTLQFSQNRLISIFKRQNRFSTGNPEYPVLTEQGNLFSEVWKQRIDWILFRSLTG